jgi:hypothetical protein
VKNVSIDRRHTRVVAVMFFTAVLLLAAGVIRVFWPEGAGDATRVLGQQFIQTVAGKSSNNNGCGNGNGGPSGSKNCDNSGHSVVVAAQVNGTLHPGGSATVEVRVTNPNNQPVTLTNIHPVLSRPVGSSCNLSWFVLNDFTTPTPIAKGAATTLNLPLTMVESNTNQDSCKSTVLSVSVTATVTGA